MAVAFDAVGPSSSGATSASSTALSWTHTCGASATYLLAACALDIASDAGLSVTATYNTVAMTPVGSAVHSGGLTEGFIQLWAMASPPTGSAYTVAITAAGGTPRGLNGGSVSFTGASALSAAQTVTGSDPAPALGFTGSSAGNMVAVFAGATNPLTSTAGTSAYLLTGDNIYYAGNTAGSTIAGGGTVTCSWSESNSPYYYAVIGVEVQAGGSSGATVTLGSALAVITARPAVQAGSLVTTYATAYDTTAVAGTGTWASPANAENAPDGSWATWTAP